MSASRIDPYKNFNFLVTIDGISGAEGGVQGSFSEVSGLEAEIEVIEYRSGADAIDTVRKLTGLQKYTNITLKRGFVADLNLWNWFDSAMQGQVTRANVSIVLLDEARNPVLQWNFVRAWPCKWKASMFNGKCSEIVIETLEICHEGMSIATAQ
jgi:phage tail-like protein